MNPVFLAAAAEEQLATTPASGSPGGSSGKFGARPHGNLLVAIFGSGGAAQPRGPLYYDPSKMNIKAR